MSYHVNQRISSIIRGHSFNRRAIKAVQIYQLFTIFAELGIQQLGLHVHQQLVVIFANFFVYVALISIIP